MREWHTECNNCSNGLNPFLLSVSHSFRSFFVFASRLITFIIYFRWELLMSCGCTLLTISLKLTWTPVNSASNHHLLKTSEQNHHRNTFEFIRFFVSGILKKFKQSLCFFCIFHFYAIQNELQNRIANEIIVAPWYDVQVIKLSSVMLVDRVLFIFQFLCHNFEQIAHLFIWIVRPSV